MLKLTHVALITTFLFLLGCKPTPIDYPEDVKNVLNNASKNRAELEAIILHYSKKPEDSLKLQAAYFIIRNLEGFRALDTMSINNNIYFDVLQEFMQKENKPKLNFFQVATVIDSINKVKKITAPESSAKYVMDLEVLSADFLIHNIDKAFLAWHNNLWSKSLSFTDFCEYVLPYRNSNNYAQNDIRSYFMSRYKGLIDSIKNAPNSLAASKFIINDIDSCFRDDIAIFNRYPYLKPTKFSNLLKGRIGTCQDVTILKITALRALGIPAVMDKVPHWGNDDTEHFMFKVINTQPDTAKLLITNANYPINTQNIATASSYDLRKLNPTPGIVPTGVKKHYIRTVPKVYRECFSIQSNSLAAIKNKEDKIPPYFLNNRLKDVTNDYLKTTDVAIKLSKVLPNEKYVYLCVFDHKTEKWIPISWALAKNNAAEFKNMGRNIVYLPAYYQDEIVAAGHPFLLNEEGKIEEIIPKKDKETVKLYMKYPYRILVEDWQSYMIGLRFQLVNKPDFSDSLTVHTIKNVPFYQTEIPINVAKKYRYLVCPYNGLSDEALIFMSIGELEVFTKDKNNRQVKLTGRIIGDSGAYMREATQMIDGKRESYFRNKKDSVNYIGIDFGEGNAQKVSKIKFLARNDDNGVVENVKFELFYWNNKWQSLGFATGNKDKTAIFKNVPINALLLLKNTEGGTENRIFTYKNGMQLFW